MDYIVALQATVRKLSKHKEKEHKKKNPKSIWHFYGLIQYMVNNKTSICNDIDTRSNVRKKDHHKNGPAPDPVGKKKTQIRQYRAQKL